MSVQPNPASPILVVDDERSALDGFEIALATAGYTNVVAMEDSRNVLPFLDENAVELILLDLIMPHVSGSELLVAIRRRAPGDAGHHHLRGQRDRVRGRMHAKRGHGLHPQAGGGGTVQESDSHLS
jgi:CheY-like chemotaxis protein